MLVAEQEIRNEMVEEGVQDDRPSNGKVVGIVGTSVDHVGVRGLGDPVSKKRRARVARQSLRR